MFKSFYENWITQKPQGNEKYFFVVGYKRQAEQLMLSGYHPVLITPGDESSFSFDEFIDAIQGNRFSFDYVYVLCLSQRDNQILENILTGKGIESIIDGWKLFDDNRDLIADRLDDLIISREADTNDIDKIKDHNALSLLPGFREHLKNTEDLEPIKTGFSRFDDAIGGGIYPGRLYIFGAVPGLGKTTFALQMGDYIAKHGTDVIFITQEMAKEDLIARSVSRITYDIACQAKNIRLAKTELGISAGWRYKKYSNDELFHIERAFDAYEDIAKNLYFYEGKQSVNGIRDIISRHKEATGKTPFVIIDYLQIMKPEGEYVKALEKMQIDYNVTGITTIRRELNVPIFLISSFNRSSYNQSDVASFKGSGEIEYNADVVCNLDYNLPDREELVSYNTKSGYLDSKSKDSRMRNAAKAAPGKDPREIILHISKNRCGKSGEDLYYYYKPMFNSYYETEQFISSLD